MITKNAMSYLASSVETVANNDLETLHQNVRPHYAHVLYTPHEISKNPELLEVKPKLQKLNYDRINANRNYCCKEIE